MKLEAEKFGFFYYVILFAQPTFNTGAGYASLYSLFAYTMLLYT